MSTYTLIIAVSAIIIISFFFNIIAKRTNIPSVLLLIGLGVCIKEFGGSEMANSVAKPGLLEIIGNVGLVMIVLEAALDLNLKREKLGMILRSFFIALLALVGSSFAIAYLIMYFIIGDFDHLYQGLIYAIPLSIMSSAIIIPSVGGLKGAKKEFMVYESTFSDILGIMFFYFMLEADAGSSSKEIATDVLVNIGITIGVSIVLSYLLVYIFQKLTSQVKLFLVISVLMLLYALGKRFHLSSLLIILTFGLILNNTHVFFRGWLSRVVNKETVKPILHDFHIVTLESAFVIRTFFFVIFGMFITLSSIIDWKVAVISLAIVAALYLVRFILLKIIVQRDIVPQLYIAPRGLITILLFFVIDSHVGSDGINHLKIDGFDTGILLFVILITSLVMTLALIIYRGDNVKDVLLSQMPGIKVDKDNDGINDNFEDIVEENVEKPDMDGM